MIWKKWRSIQLTANHFNFFQFLMVGFACLLFILALFGGLSVSWNSVSPVDAQTSREVGTISLETVHSLNHSTKLVLVWVDNEQSLSYHSFRASRTFSDCPEKRCAITTDRRLFNRSATLLFIASAITCPPGSPTEVKRAFPEQTFTFVLAESPINAEACGFMRKRHFFNWTMTYRLDSDLRNHYTYSMPVEKKPRDFAQGKTKLVAWLVSHCTTQSQREKYVAELRKYIPVDVYGKCGNLSCGSTCMERLKEYKFYLAFENSLCRDYATEKAVMALEHETVPVVYGDGNYGIFPPNSYVDIYNFSSPSALAEHLLHLDRNNTAYNELMKWRYSSKVSQSSGMYSAKVNGFCRLCRMLHAPTRQPKSYQSIDKWWKRGVDRGLPTEGMCREPDFLLSKLAKTA